MTNRADSKTRLIFVFTLLVMMISSGLTSKPAFSADRPQVHTVIISGFKFTPAVLQVNAGDTIVWVNQDIVPHTATADDKSWDTGMIESQGQKELIVTKKQSPAYFCFYHPAMKATLVMNIK